MIELRQPNSPQKSPSHTHPSSLPLSLEPKALALMDGAPEALLEPLSGAVAVEGEHVEASAGAGEAALILAEAVDADDEGRGACGGDSVAARDEREQEPLVPRRSPFKRLPEPA